MTGLTKAMGGEANNGQRSTSGGLEAQPFLGFNPADFAAVRVRPVDFARMMGVSKQTVSGWIKRGVVTLGPDGRLDPNKAGREVIANTDPARVRARVLKGAMDDVGGLKRQLAERDQQLAQARHALAAVQSGDAGWMHADDVERRTSALLNAVAEHLSALAEAQRRGLLAEALDWLAAATVRQWQPEDLAEAFGESDAVLRELFGIGRARAGPS